MPTILNPAPGGAFVDADALCCPGCHETVIVGRPFGRGLRPLPGVEFAHRDGSELCCDGRGRVCEPIEARR